MGPCATVTKQRDFNDNFVNVRKRCTKPKCTKRFDISEVHSGRCGVKYLARLHFKY